MSWKVTHEPGKKPKPCHKLPAIAFRPIGQVIQCDKCGKSYRLTSMGAHQFNTHLEWVEQ